MTTYVTETQKVLHEFLADWYAWASNPSDPKVSPRRVAYSPRHGLCWNMREFMYEGDVRNMQIGTASEYMKHLMNLHTRSTYLQYPFGYDDYHTRQDNGTMHRCPKRLAFAKKYGPDFEIS
jgi:hypothetical protein